MKDIHDSTMREQGIVLHGEHELFGGSIDRVYRHEF
jgi:hypothetical protein